jgi:hypothetical protein
MAVAAGRQTNWSERTDGRRRWAGTCGDDHYRPRRRYAPALRAGPIVASYRSRPRPLVERGPAVGEAPSTARYNESCSGQRQMRSGCSLIRINRSREVLGANKGC